MVKRYRNTVWHNLKAVNHGDSTENIAFQVIDPSFTDGLTDSTVSIFLKDSASGEVVKQFDSNGHGVTVNDVVTGQFSWDPWIVLAKPGTYLYEVIIRYNEQVIKKRFSGNLEVLKTAKQCPI